MAATVGLADVDSVTLATGSLMRGGLAANIGAHAILIAVLMNTLAKGVIGLLAGGWRFALYYCAAAGAAAALGAAAWFLATPIIAPMFG